MEKAKVSCVVNTFHALNNALDAVSDQAFKVLYHICNNLNLNNATRIEIDRYDIARRLGKIYDGMKPGTVKNHLDKITEVTDELVEKGFIKKDVIYNKATGKRTAFYSIGDEFLRKTGQTSSQKSCENEQKSGVTKKHIKQESIESKQSTESSEKSESKQKAPDEESLAAYRRRMKLALPEDEENDNAEVVHLFEAQSPYGDGLPF